MKHFIYLILIGIAISLGACSDYLNPNPFDGVRTDEYVWNNASYAKGVVMNAYQGIPTTYRLANGQFLEYATDDAVSNNPSSSIRNLGLGQLSSTSNTLNSWDSKYGYIRNANEFLENGTQGIVYYAADPDINVHYTERLKGEALFLRAYYHWELLKLFGGVVNGQAMGIPIVKKALTEDEAKELERPTYADCVDAIIEDCNEAESLLPDIYEGNDPVTGAKHYGGATSHACRALKAVVSVYNASKSYNLSANTELWNKAAGYLLEALTALDGAINSNALPARNFFEPENNDVIWRSSYANKSLTLEKENYSPSMFGDGLTNPSQNLVDAFPDSYGYPITESSIYSKEDPYKNRDKRLNNYILYNGASFNSTTIETFQGGKDSKEVYGTSATTTGYYLSKFLSNNATLSPVELGGHPTFYAVFSKTDLYLYLAEVLNEIEGPDGKSVSGVSAKGIISKVRKRAGYNTDNYLNSISDSGVFTELIKNERRIELCFEGFRFWDLRRWNEKVDNVGVNGVSIIRNAVTGKLTYTHFKVETRKFKSIYMPLPNDQIYLMSNLEQNDGWK